MPALSAQFNFQTPQWQQRAAWVLMGIIAYGSLFPLDWEFDTPNKFGWFEHVGRLDVVKNIALFIPLGLLVAVMEAHKEHHVAHVWRWVAGTFALAALLQIAQIYLPREPEAADVLTNMIGFGVGYLIKPPLARLHFAAHHGGRIASEHPFLLVLVAIWLCAAMFPFIPVWRADMLRDQMAELLRWEWNKPRQLIMHAGLTYLGAYTLYWTIKPLPRLGRHAGLIVGFALLAALQLKLIGFSQSPGLAAVAGMVLGLICWVLVHQAVSASAQTMLVGAIGLILYLTYAILPLNFRDPVFFQWWPFGSLLGGNLSVVLRSYCTEALALGALMWAMTQAGMRLSVVVIALACLGFAAEWLQRYLQYRTPEIGTVIMVLLLGFLLALFKRCEK